MNNGIEAGQRPHAESRLRFVEEVEPGAYPSGGKYRRARFECDCGRVTTTSIGLARQGRTRSCGCLHDQAMAANRSHGMTGSPIYKAYRAMRTRCSTHFQQVKPTYSGVTFCSEWSTFEGFLANQPSGRAFADGLVLARFGDQGDYSPANCYWATKAENSRDLVERIAMKLPDGRLLVDVARAHGIAAGTAKQRVCAYGWDPVLAATTPASTKFRRKSA